MKVQQRLTSGTIIAQDFRTSVRFPIFETGYAEWPYATNGGTLFLVMFRGRVFGLTCRHVLDGFEWPRLRVTEAKFGKMFAPIQGLVYPSAPKGEAVDTDILDIAVVEFGPEVTPGSSASLVGARMQAPGASRCQQLPPPGAGASAPGVNARRAPNRGPRPLRAARPDARRARAR